MATADEQQTFEKEHERDSDVIWSLSYSLSSIETAEGEEKSDQKPSAKATAAIVQTNNDAAENDPSIIIGKPSDNTCDGSDYKAMIHPLIVPKTDGPCVSSWAAACPHDDKSQGYTAYDEHDGKAAVHVHTALHPDTAQRVVTEPHVKDVLFGRCKQAKTHSGNQMLRAICDHKRRIYDLADRDDKTEITRSIVHEIKSSGGSFLKFSKALQVWLEVDDDEARRKVGHMMRNGRLQPLGRLEPEMFPPVTERGSIGADEPS